MFDRNQREETTTAPKPLSLLFYLFSLFFLFFSLFLVLSTFLSLSLSFYRSLCLSRFVSLALSLSLFVFVSFFLLSLSLSLSQFPPLCLHLSQCVSVCTSFIVMRQSECEKKQLLCSRSRLTKQPSVGAHWAHLSLSLCISLCLSVSFSISLNFS